MIIWIKKLQRSAVPQSRVENSGNYNREFTVERNLSKVDSEVCWFDTFSDT